MTSTLEDRNSNNNDQLSQQRQKPKFRKMTLDEMKQNISALKTTRETQKKKKFFNIAPGETWQVRIDSVPSTFELRDMRAKDKREINGVKIPPKDDDLVEVYPFLVTVVKDAQGNNIPIDENAEPVPFDVTSKKLLDDMMFQLENGKQTLIIQRTGQGFNTNYKVSGV